MTPTATRHLAHPPSTPASIPPSAVDPAPKDAMMGSLAHSGRVIFAAGAVMVAVLFAFALSGPLPAKEVGIVLGVAVLLDAFLVRPVLLPVLTPAHRPGGLVDASVVGPSHVEHPLLPQLMNH